MQPSLALGCGVVIAAVCYHFATPLPPATPSDPPVSSGHLILVVEGNVQHLDITHAVAKQDAWGGVPTGLASAFELRIDGADGSTFARIPVDLSRFDLDPSRIGKPPVVTGCDVKDSRIGLLLNVPDYPTATRYVFVHGERVIGEVPAARVRALTGGGR
ncbi:MAG: hypothetical protein IPK26_22865 [Planctomycetes bacterium]|nr:hypothetical protein [Planctomycetota bacterium]